MAIPFLSPANTSFLSLSSSSSSSSSIFPQKQHNAITHLPFCIKTSVGEGESAGLNVCMGKRVFSLSLSSVFLIPLAGKYGVEVQAAVLEAEDDLELLEKVKQDKKKRIEKQGIINSSKKEIGYLQELVFKLSEVGQAIDNNDLNTATSVLGTTTDTDWFTKANSAFTKLSSNPEEKAEVDEFNNSISELILSVAKKDTDTSKIAFVSSATAFEKWTALTGLNARLKGL